MTDQLTVFPNWRAFTSAQRQGWNCALCGQRLYADRLVGTVIEPAGYPGKTQITELWACAPACPTPGRPS